MSEHPLWPSVEQRKAELDWEKIKADRELRRWCIERVDTSPGSEHAISQAEKIYDWVRNQAKASA